VIRIQLVARVLMVLLLGILFVCHARSDDIVVVVGAGGEAVYTKQFNAWADQWDALAKESQVRFYTIGRSGTDRVSDSKNDKESLQELMRNLATKDESPLWIVFLGHGTFQQGIAKFNLEGPDISAEEFAASVEPIKRPLVVINCSSASGPWLGTLSGPNRVIITATKSGDEQNFVRFGKFLADAISDPRADLDHDRNVSILEAFLLAASETEQFYESEGRLLTEHPLLDDTGDRMGTPPHFFRGVRVTGKTATQTKPDGQIALSMILKRDGLELELSDDQRTRVTELEGEIRFLRSQKTQLTDDQYYAQLEALLVEMARLEVALYEVTQQPIATEPATIPVPVDVDEPGGVAKPASDTKSETPAEQETEPKNNVD
jgi:hypothetical protein